MAETPSSEAQGFFYQSDDSKQDSKTKLTLGNRLGLTSNAKHMTERARSSRSIKVADNLSYELNMGKSVVH